MHFITELKRTLGAAVRIDRLRALLGTLSLAYAIAASFLPLFLVRSLLAPAQWWAAGLALQALLYVSPLAVFVLRQPKPAQRWTDRIGRASFLAAILWIALFAFLGFPAALIVLLPATRAREPWLITVAVLLGVLVTQSVRRARHGARSTSLIEQYACAHRIRMQDVTIDELPASSRINPKA